MIHYSGHQKQFNPIPVSEVIEECSKHDLVELDLETTGLDVHTCKILTVQLGIPGHQYVVELTDGVVPSELALWMSRTPARFIGHNLKFDIKFLLGVGIKLNSAWCTFLAEKTIHTGHLFELKFDLASVLFKRLDVVMSKDVRGSFVDHVGDITEDQLKYAAKDVEHLTEIYHMQQQDLRRDDLLNAAGLECAVMLSFAEMEYNGIGIDVEAWSKLADETSGLRDIVVHQMDQMILKRSEFEEFKPHSFQTDMFTDDSDSLVSAIDINWASQKDVLPVIQKITSEKVETLDTKILRRDYGGTHNMVDAFIDFVDFNKKATSFGHEWISKYVNEATGRVHTRINQIMATGRVSSHAPNLQQIPSDARYRDCFRPNDGNVFITTDYGSQELVVIATGAQDEVWLDALKKGHDLHSICAELVFGQKWDDATEDGCAYAERKQKCGCSEHKKLRTRTKAISFGLAYGAGPGSLGDTLQISKDDAEKLMDEYFTAFPRIKAWLDGNARAALQKRESRTFSPIRRRRLYDKERVIDFKTRGMIDRRGRNTVIQGTSADITKLAQIYLRQELRDYPEAMLVAVIHDEILVECPEAIAKDVADRIQFAMEAAGQRILKHDLLKAEPEIGSRWAK